MKSKNSRFQVINIIKSDHPLKVKLTLLWRRCRHGVTNIPVYFLLISMSFVFLLPFVYMILTSLMSTVDQANASLVKWLPRDLSMVGYNYKNAITALNYWPKLWTSAWTTALCILGQVISCTFVAYGLARLKFKGRGIIFGLVIFTLIIPPQVIVAPLFYMFSKNSPFGLEWYNTFLPMIVPCFFAMGLGGGLFIFVYRQYFKTMPAELENAALIDGCGIFGSYVKVILPNTKSPMLVCLILSLVWQWNNFFEPSVFILDAKVYGNLPMQLEAMKDNMGNALYSSTQSGAMDMAATFLVILPIILVFFLLQNQFMKSIERVGLAN